MHRVIQDHLEEVLSESPGDQNSPGVAHLAAHLAECEECREEVADMRLQASMLRALRAPKALEESPRPGFYARVMERVEAHPASIWQLFFDSVLARRIAIASMALVVLFSVYLVSSERYAAQPRTVIVFSDDDQSGMTLSKSGMPDRDSVLVNLVTYREQ
jgi:anti-sigma factor RsiW